MKKYIVLWITLMSIIAGTTSTYAGGGFFGSFTYDQTDLNQVVDSIKDTDIKSIVQKNILQATQNTITEDWEYDNKNYYTKKLLLAITIPNDLKSKVSSAYISLWASSNIPTPIMYNKKDSDTWSTEVDTTSSTEFKINLDKNNIPTEVMLSRNDLEKYIKGNDGASFNGKLVLELTDGTVLPFSSMGYLYIQKDWNDAKIAQLSNLYYTANPNTSGWVNTQDLLKSAFDNLSKKYTKLDDYVTVLTKIINKIDTLSTGLKSQQTALVSKIIKEDDFKPLIDSAQKLADKIALLDDIKYQISSEIKTKQSQNIIDDLFSNN